MVNDSTLPPPPAPATEPAPALQGPAPARQIDGVPMMFMRGGTTTTNFDKYVMEFDADTKVRWAEQDKERAAASIPIERGGAQRLTKDLGSPTTHPVAVIQLLLPGGREQFMQADVVIGEEGDIVTRVLVMLCPKCRQRGLPGHMCQIKIDDRNKRWTLDEKYKGHVWVDPDTNEALVLAGAVDIQDICSCPTPGCGFRFRVSDARNAEYPGVSRLVQE